MAIYRLDCRTSLRYVRNDGSIIVVRYGILQRRCCLIVFPISGYPIDITCTREGICWNFAHLDDASITLSDNSEVGVNRSIDASGENYSGTIFFRHRIRTGFELKNRESGIYVFESGNPIAIPSGSLESRERSKSDGSEDDEDGDDDDEFDEGETVNLLYECLCFYSFHTKEK